MQPVLFLQSEVENPYPIYRDMLSNNPVFWDDANKIWAVYNYQHCQSLLMNPAAVIPALNTTGLNEYALAIAGKLARFCNPPYHAIARRVAIAVFNCIQPVSIRHMVAQLLLCDAADRHINWVDTVCKTLPVLHILQGLEFSRTDAEVIIAGIAQLVQITRPDKTYEQIKAINDTAKTICGIVQNHLNNTAFLQPVINNLVEDTKCTKEDLLSLCLGNLTGLMIQAYDASRGLLSNVLLQYLANKKGYRNIINDKDLIQKFVIETLRYNPPVHNTRRTAAENIIVGTTEIKKGASILLVLAAANRDEQHFRGANLFDMERSNNHEQLTFGAGPHACVAAQLAVQMATETLCYLFSEHPGIHLLSEKIQYEATINVRLPEKIIIALTP